MVTPGMPAAETPFGTAGHRLDLLFYSSLPSKIRKFLLKNKEVLKDLDFLNLSRRFQNSFQINISKNDRRKLLKIIEKDV